jgi:sugar lactone lactonase YvrE
LRKVLTVDLQGNLEEIVTVPNSPSGLGFDPQDRLLIVSMNDRRLLRLDAEGLSEVANIYDLASYHCNDMVVAKNGNAYIGNFGFDLSSQPQNPKPAEVVLIKPNGEAQIVAKDMMFPNGSVISPENTTIIIAETYAQRLTVFNIESDGDLTNRRIWAQLDPNIFPDGICLDEKGAIWVASPSSAEVLRVLEGGEVTDRIRVSKGRSAYACMLGGTDRKTLFICTSDPTQTRGAIEYTKVEYAGAGLP